MDEDKNQNKNKQVWKVKARSGKEGGGVFYNKKDKTKYCPLQQKMENTFQGWGVVVVGWLKSDNRDDQQGNDRLETIK